MRNFLIALYLLITCTCNNPRPETDSTIDNDQFFEINYEEILKNKKTMTLRQVASNVEYIKLETNDNCLIGKIRNFYFTDSLIFVNNTDHILKFLRNGRFLQKIGNSGRGPREIDFINSITIIPEKKMIAVQKSAVNEMLYFSFDGEVIKTVKIPRAYCIKVMNDGKFINYDHGVWGSNKYTFSLTSEKGDTISAIKNYYTWKNTWGGVLSVGSWPEPFIYKDNWYFKDKYNDTVYTVISDRIKPSFSVNLGKYKLPDELRPESLSLDKMYLYQDNALNYYNIDLFKASEKLFIESRCYLAKGGKKFLIYDKEENKGILLYNGGDISTGFVNDWDGGIDFWPLGVANDNQVFMIINIMTLKQELERVKTGKKTVKYYDKQKELEKIIFESNISDNPVIMMVTLKTDIQLNM